MKLDVGRLRWLGLLGRMYDDRLPKKMLFARTADSARSRGCPRASWKDTVLHVLGIKNELRWYRSCQDRNRWQCMSSAKGT